MRATSQIVTSLDQLPVGFATLDSFGVVRIANRRAADLLGSANELASRSLEEFIAPADRAAVTAWRHEIDASRQTEVCEVRLAGKAGGGSWVRLEGCPRADVDDGSPLLQVVISDVTQRRLAELSLRESEERYRKLFSESSDCIAITDDLTHELVDCNAAFERLLGLSRTELLGRAESDLFCCDESALPGLLSFPLPRPECSDAQSVAWLRNQAGDLRLIEARKYNVHRAGIPVSVGVFRDCTEQRRTGWERELSLALLRVFQASADADTLVREATKLMQAATGCEAVGIRLRVGDDFPYAETRGFPQEFVRLESSLCTRDRDGTPQRDGDGDVRLECMCGNIVCGRVNPELSFFTRGGSFWSNWTTNLLATTSDSDRQARTRNRCNGFGYESVALIPIRHAGQVLGLLQLNDHREDRFDPHMIRFLEGIAGQLGTALSQRWASSALQDSERKLRYLMGNIPGMVYSRRPDWSCEFVSKSEELSGYMPEELTSGAICWLDIVHADDRSALSGEAVASLQDNAPRVRKYRIVTRSGATRWVEDHATARVGPGGALDGIDGVVFDVTVARQMEADLRQAQKLESIGRLAGGVAHDFNNLLLVIANCTTFALESVTPDHELHADLTEIQRTADRAASLTRQLLAFSRKQLLQPRVLSMNAVVRDMEPMLRRLLGEGIRIVVHLDSTLPNVEVDPGQLEQVLLNLCINARDAMDSSGTLTIRTTCLVVDGLSTSPHPSLGEGAFVMLSVSDTGAGIPADVRDHVFEPFFTTKPAGSGTGLGLSTVYGIVAQSGGSVWVDGAAQAGSTFHVCLPCVDRPLESPAPPLARTSGSETVLVVEDDARVRALVGRMLNRCGYRVLSAATPAEAIGLCTAHPASIGVILVDLVMPQMNGPELVARLEPLAPQARALYMSGYANQRDSRARTDERASFIAKPFSRADLASKIHTLLHGAIA